MEFPLTKFIELAKSKDKSEDYIRAISEYVYVLEKNGYPVIFTRQHLAQLIGIQSNFLKYLLDEGEYYHQEPWKQIQDKYASFTLKKRSGGTRLIMAPQEDLKYIQKWIQINILNSYKFEKSCVGFIKGKSIKDNAIVHESADIILKVDLLRFFDTIDVKRIYWCFKRMGYIGNVCHDLADLCTVIHREEYWRKIKIEDQNTISRRIGTKSRVLPQGAPTSPLLANIVASRMDKRFEKLSESLGAKYTRYADDLTFSIKGEGELPSLKVIYKIIGEEGFFPNKRKTKFSNKGHAQYVTGLTVANGVNIKKSKRKEIERHIYFCKKYGVDNHLEKNKKTLYSFNRMSFHDWLYGHLCFIKSINPRSYNKLFEEYKKINWYL